MEHLGTLYERHDDDIEHYYEDLDRRAHPKTLEDTPENPKFIPVRIDLRLLEAKEDGTLPILQWENEEPIMWIPWKRAVLPPGIQLRRDVDEIDILDRVLRKTFSPFLDFFAYPTCSTVAIFMNQQQYTLPKMWLRRPLAIESAGDAAAKVGEAGEGSGEVGVGLAVETEEVGSREGWVGEGGAAANQPKREDKVKASGEEEELRRRASKYAILLRWHPKLVEILAEVRGE